MVIMTTGANLAAQTNSVAATPTANNFTYPQSLFIDSQNGHVWVADFDNHRVLRFDVSTLTTVSKMHSISPPEQYVLAQNYPNPFNPVTRIGFTLFNSGFTSLKVFNLLGKEVATLVDHAKEAGIHTVTFDASRLPSGIYFYTIRSGTFVETKRMILLK